MKVSLILLWLLIKVTPQVRGPLWAMLLLPPTSLETDRLLLPGKQMILLLGRGQLALIGGGPQALGLTASYRYAAFASALYSSGVPAGNSITGTCTFADPNVNLVSLDTTLTLTNSDGLDEFQVGDVVQSDFYTNGLNITGATSGSNTIETFYPCLQCRQLYRLRVELNSYWRLC